MNQHEIGEERIEIGANDITDSGALAFLKGRYGIRLLRVLSPIFLIAIWELAARVGYVDTRFFPSPSGILLVAERMLETGELWGHIYISGKRILMGFFIGAVPGILIGIAMGLWAPVSAIVEPLIDATFPIPKIAILPLFIMIFGLGEESKYAIIATAVIYLVLINTAAGVRNIDKIYLDVGKNFNASNEVKYG